MALKTTKTALGSAASTVRTFVFGGKTCCFCFPVRIGVLIMSSVAILLSGVLSVVLWYEVSTILNQTDAPRSPMVIAAVVETLLFIASIMGFVGAVSRKLSFVVLYSYFVYAHLALTVVVAGYFLYVVNRAEHNIVVQACQQTVRDATAKKECEGLARIVKGAYLGLVALILITQSYGAIIIYRYSERLRSQKGASRAERQRASTADPQNTIPLSPLPVRRLTSSPTDQTRTLLYSDPYAADAEGDAFNPYEEVVVATPKTSKAPDRNDWKYQQIDNA